jgi:ABC-2 type transport system permease protein
MSRAISSELLKLRTTRTFLALVCSAALLVGAASVLAAALGTWRTGDTRPGEDLVGITYFAMMFALVLGVLAVSTEFRHGTIAPTLLAVPGRGRMIAAKLAAHLVAGFLLVLAATLLDLALVEVVTRIRGIDSGTTLSEAAGWALGLGVTGALITGVGVGVGAIVRNQVGSIVGAFAWIFVIEPLLTAIPHVGDAIGRYGIGGLIDALDGIAADSADDLPAQVPAGLLLAAYAVILSIVGAILLNRRDVTA